MSWTAERAWLSFAGICTLAVLAWLSVSAGVPEIARPAPFLVIVPVMISESMVIGIVVVPLMFACWSLPALGRSAVVPRRSIGLLALLIILSAVWLASGWDVGLEYHSPGYTAGVAVLNLLLAAASVLLAVLAHRRVSWVWSFSFHWALFAWLAWCAFPWLGELP
jgi:hypothetical protein